MTEVWDLATKTIDELHAEVERLLPKGWTFQVDNQETLHLVSVLDETGSTVWTETVSPDVRLALLSVYGWLSTRKGGPSITWRDRARKKSQPLSFWVAEDGTVGIEDLDPEGIASVYKLSEDFE